MVIRRWDAATGVEQAQLPFPNVLSLAMMPSGDQLAAGYADGLIELRDPFTLELAGELLTLPGGIDGIAFSSNHHGCTYPTRSAQ